ncbi:choice-of-anchor L domain-containing protein, partial [Flavobacterium sp. SUN052]|uniref:choice-of-anchor L domain-containing protein n=1 Tax=Flavobacterium sp. SUN052 TaxID=3002441 RepID=UPI00237DF1F2
MKKTLLFLAFIFICQNGFSQAISVNSTTYTVPQLVQNVLFGSSASAACAGTVSNITWSTGNTGTNNSTNGIGYFTNTNPSFPLANGVILSTGLATAAPGPNTTTQGNGTWPGDPQLLAYLQSLGVALPSDTHFNATILEFDFVPLSSTMSFDFLFASEEYGTFQCSYSDAFAFFLTNLTTGSAPVNLALVPSTPDPISVTTIRNNANNNSCPSVNPTYFGSYTAPPSAAASAAATNFNGLTVQMTAASVVTPNDLYHIKLVIADRNDSSYDSAVFLAGGSFNIGSAITSGSGFNNPSYTIADGTAICFGGSRDIVFGASSIAGATYTWYLGTNPIFSGPSNTYTVTQPGNYTVTVTLPSGCQYSSTNAFVVEFLPQFPLSQPLDLTEPTGIFNLGSNTPVMLNGANPTNYEISYHLSLIDAQNIANPIVNTTTFPGTNGQVIYVAIQDLVGAGCTEVKSFILNTSCSTITNPSANQSICIGGDPAQLCVNTTFSGVDAIEYVYFTTPQSGDAMYTGGVLLGYATPNASGVACYDPAALGNLGSLPNLSGTYYIYAIANPAPVDLTCRPFQLIQVDVTTNATVTLTSAAATTNQTVCVNSPITPITYTFGGSATGATVTGLPAGVTATVSGTTITISGSPNTTLGSPFGYTVNTTGGSCGTASLSGTITVNPLAVIILTSTVATTNQTVCINSPITPITYNFGGTATGATVTGLPGGVTASTTGNTVTISGTPITSVGSPFSYTITTTGGNCGFPSLSGTITVSPTATLTLTSAGSTTSQTVCIGSPIT